MKLFLFLLLLLSSPGVSAAPLPDIFATPPAPAPPRLLPHLPGDLARDRLERMSKVLLSSDTVAVAQIGQPESPLSPARAKAVLASLSDLVLDDALYVGNTDYDGRDKSRAVVLQIGEFGHQVQVSVGRDKPLLTITREDGVQWVTANYLPVVPKVVKLLRAIDPDDPGPNMTLVKAPPLPSTKGVPPSVLTRIATLKPGMTRADVLHQFTPNGGLSSTYSSRYVYRKVISSTGKSSAPLEVPGGTVQVNIDFAPQDADILWLDGRGLWLHQSEYESQHTAAHYSELPSDIVLRVSAPFVGYMAVD